MIPGKFDALNFVFNYTALFLFIVLLAACKIIRVKRGDLWGWIPASQIDLTSDLDMLDAMTKADVEMSPKNIGERMTAWLF